MGRSCWVEMLRRTGRPHETAKAVSRDRFYELLNQQVDGAEDAWVLVDRLWHSRAL